MIRAWQAGWKQDVTCARAEADQQEIACQSHQDGVGQTTSARWDLGGYKEMMAPDLAADAVTFRPAVLLCLQWPILMQVVSLLTLL